MLSITEFSEQSRLILYSFANTAYAPHGDGNVYSSTTTDPAIRNTAYAPHGDGNRSSSISSSPARTDTAFAPHGDSNILQLDFDMPDQNTAYAPYGDGNIIVYPGSTTIG